ncbi:MAG: hypothetical protein QXJ27_00560 [Thermoplasmata archaeon]
MAVQPPPYVPPPQPQPMQQISPPQPMPPPRPQPQYPISQPLAPKPETPGIVSNKLLVLFVFLGMVMLTLGAMMIHAAPEITNKDYSGYTDANKIRADDQRLQTTVTDIGHLMADVGALLIVTFLLLAALLRSDWSDTIRFGLLLAVGLFLLGFAFTI